MSTAIESAVNLVKTDFKAVNDLIVEQLQSDVFLINQISKHIIHSGGKRLRPILVLLAAKACNYQGSQHIAASAIIEFIHTATLLHDDVVDESELRRGEPTANNLLVMPLVYWLVIFIFTQLSNDGDLRKLTYS